MRTALVPLLLGALSGCWMPATADLPANETDVYASAMNALLQLPPFAQDPESAKGYCLGISVAAQSPAQPQDPAGSLLSQIDISKVPLFLYSECDMPSAGALGDVPLRSTGTKVGRIVLAPIQWQPDGSAKVNVQADGGPFSSAGFACSVPPAGQAECQMSWIS